MEKWRQTVIVLIFSALVYSAGFSVIAQPAAHDTIVRLGGRRMIVDVISVSASDVSYKDIGSEELQQLNHKYIERIIYRSGKVDIFNKPVVQLIDENRWEAVLITENKADVEGMYEYGLVRSSSSSDARNMKAAKKSATIRLQKRAANMGANVVLITKSIAVGGYGETPGYNMEGIAYGFRPPAEKKQQEENKSE